MAIGAALALRDTDRLPVAVIGQCRSATPLRFPPGTDIIEFQPRTQFQVGLQ